ncbi:MAG: di-trans,poly-cis-decaprenylcistransferase [Ruminococcaceae bacterium]|nr:di-trans,poly-cis-decaprenylcistransferase [Oscillospiraceae bacterium]
MADKKNASPSGEGRLRHIAFIMDGNGRWAKKRGMPRTYGHAAGAKVFKKIVEYCGAIGIEAVTVYAFSTENWRRPKEEVDAILSLFTDYIGEAERSFRDKDIQLHFLGSKEVFPPELKARMERLEEVSKDRRLILNIAVNYGGRDDIVHAVNTLIAEGKRTITEEDITSRLYTKDSPAPDLIVRTGAEKRLSNFLLWEAAYAELYFTEVLWPDFDEKQVDLCVEEFYGRRRRYGAI